MKRILIALLLCVVIATPALAEENSSAAQDFLDNLSATWDSFLKMGGEAIDSATNWVNNDLVNWINNDLPAWADSTAQSIQVWLDDAGQWTQDAAANLQTFVEENGPAVEAWLNQAGEDVQKAWDTLTNPKEHTGEEVEAAYETVMDTLEEAQIANPWEDVTAEALKQKSGVAFGVPEGAEDVVYRWLESGHLAEMQFKMFGDEFCARIQPAQLENGQLMNISGMYFDWEHEEAVAIGHCDGTLGQAQTGSSDWVELCQWYDPAPGLMYSLSVYTTEPDGLDLTAVAQMVYLPVQSN